VNSYFPGEVLLARASSQADNRDFPVGRFRIPADARYAGCERLPGRLALGTVQLLGRDREGGSLDLDTGLIWGGGKVVVPGGDASRAAGRRRCSEPTTATTGRWGEILARATYDNLNRFIVRSLAGPARLVPLPALVDKDLSLAALRRQHSGGASMPIQSADGVWRSSRKAVEEYRSTRQRRRAT
jgi:hypothetical protein